MKFDPDMPEFEPLYIFIVSDATGALAESVVTSVLVQFKHRHFKLSRFPFTRTADKVNQIVDQAPRGNSVIVFSLVIPELRDLITEKGETVLDYFEKARDLLPLEDVYAED